MAGMYASAADLAAWSGQYPPANAASLLARASRDVNTALIGAHYVVDDDGQPTDTAVVAALRDATCAQAVWLIPTPPEQGRARMDRAEPAKDVMGLAPDAEAVLRAVRLLPVHPFVIG